ncbi:MAG TPA: hypothetical protein VHU23_03990 [Rhizomicrobium sp.]|jgi:dCTP deaminase|nr:hypothetical protein [Rhizomicrobium sp.]
MPTLVTEARLRAAIKDGTYLSGGDPAAVEGIKYDFHTGQRILKAAYRKPIDLDSLPTAERNQLFIAPGEIVFVLTKERLNLPSNLMALLSPKRKLSHSGILVFGGQAIDPRYSGPLWFGMYNFSSTPFPLEADRKVIAATFYELEGDEVADFPVPEACKIDDFPPELVALVNQYKPVEVKGIQDELERLKHDFQALKLDITTDKTWRDTFKGDLVELKLAVAETNKSINRLGENLDKETQLRAAEDKAIDTRLTSMSNMFFGLNLVRTIIAALLLVGLGALAEFFIPKLFGH